MPGMVLDGKALAKEIEGELSRRVETLKAQRGGKAPILATILVGGDPASATYVKMKGNACRRVGMESLSVTLPEETTTDELLAQIDALNANPAVHGILLQHPVPKPIDERLCFDRIAIQKDVDGVTCHGFGRMAMGEPAFGSATPSGIMRLLEHYQISLEGRHAVVVGRSPILGKPMALMLLNAHATVTVCHSRTKGLADLVRQADILVGAVGKPEFIKGDWIKEGAVVIDVGVNRVGDKKLVGDVEFEAARARASAITPVPGGVGPMTITMLLYNTVESAKRRAAAKA